jgi:hypothetical protein
LTGCTTDILRLFEVVVAVSGKTIFISAAALIFFGLIMTADLAILHGLFYLVLM